MPFLSMQCSLQNFLFYTRHYIWPTIFMDYSIPKVKSCVVNDPIQRHSILPCASKHMRKLVERGTQANDGGCLGS